MGIFGDMINYIIDMGASAMLPLVIAILSIIVGVKIGKAVRAGLMVGVGFVGLGLIVDMMNANLGPAAQQMSKNFGLSMSVVDLDGQECPQSHGHQVSQLLRFQSRS